MVTLTLTWHQPACSSQISYGVVKLDDGELKCHDEAYYFKVVVWNKWTEISLEGRLAANFSYVLNLTLFRCLFMTSRFWGHYGIPASEGSVPH